MIVGVLSYPERHSAGRRCTVGRAHARSAGDAGGPARNVIDAETGQRGYIITGDERYLQPHTTSGVGAAESLASASHSWCGTTQGDRPASTRCSQLIAGATHDIAGRRRSQTSRRPRRRPGSHQHGTRQSGDGRHSPAHPRYMRLQEDELLSQRAAMPKRRREA